MSNQLVVITTSIREELNNFLKERKFSKIVLLADENTYKYCFPLLGLGLPEEQIIVIKSGEEQKNLRTCEYIWDKLTNLRLDRKSLLINLGGGVIGDMGGFCAATYKRGISFVQVPTTLLAQVDASVGGKLGIDFHLFKNHIGVFRIPDAVLIDTIFLKTLPNNELRSGFAEVIKHTLIADKSKWDEIRQKSLAQQEWQNLVEHSVLIKKKVTEEDPEEKGLRKILNFGHTIGHAIESYFLNIPHKKLLHGEAIAIGMICEAYISMKNGFISQLELNEIKNYIIAIFGKTEIFEYDSEKILPLTLQDKKNEQDEILGSLLNPIGHSTYNHPLTFKDIMDSIRFYSL
jgi:3-dehydroquinate synthase